MIKHRKRRGVSLAELLVAIGVIAVGLSGVAASLYYGHAQSKHGDEIAKASQYSRMLIEIATSRGYIDKNIDTGGDGLPSASSGMNDSDSEPPRELGAPPFAPKDFIGYWTTNEVEKDESEIELGRFKRKIKMERLGVGSTPEASLVRMTVTIYWEEKSEGGKNSATLSAIVHTTNAP